MIRGRVLDRNTGHALAGLAVSNGDRIVETDASGAYAIDAVPDKHQFVCASVPDGYDPSFGFFHATTGWDEDREDVDFLFNQKSQGLLHCSRLCFVNVCDPL